MTSAHSEAPILLLLGGNKLNLGICDKFKALGYRIYVVDWNEHPDLTGDCHWRIDVKDESKILAAIAEHDVAPIALVYTSIDLAAAVALRLNAELRGHGADQVGDPARFVSKRRMTEVWRERGLLARLSALYSADAADALRRDAGGLAKLIVKPNISSSSRGITVIDAVGGEFAPHAIAGALRKAAEESADGFALVEEFVSGTEYTVELMADTRGQSRVYAISQKHHSRFVQANCVATKLLYNFDDAALQDRIATVALRCFDALDPVACLGHMELIVSDDGSRIEPIEVGFRSSGFIASHLVDQASGRDYLGDYIGVLDGQPIAEPFVANHPTAAMYYFYDAPAGSHFERPANILDFLPAGITSLYSARPSFADGAGVRAVSNDNERLGYEILVGPRDLLTMALVVEAERRMLEECLE